MKTAIRIQQYQYNGYNHMTFQILDMTFAGTISSIGYISFQQTKGEDRWYGITYNVNTSKEGDLLKMAKLAKLINKSSSCDAQPDEIKKIIGAEEYKIFNNDFVSVKQDGQNLYEIIITDQLYSRIIAPSEKEANKQLKKKNLPKIAELKFKEIVKL